MADTNLTIDQIELAIAEFFGTRNNIIVPNVSWGFFATHEADLVILNKSGYLTEIEIKRSWRDFLNDFKKHTTHDEGKVMWKYFAVPLSICEKVWQYLCDNGYKDWGVISYSEEMYAAIVYHPNNHNLTTKSNRLFLEEQLTIARLGSMRIWKLKEKLTDSPIRLMDNNNNPLTGIVLDGKYYGLASGGCIHCSLMHNGCINGQEFCIGFPYPDPEKDNCFQFSQAVTDKIKQNG